MRVPPRLKWERTEEGDGWYELGHKLNEFRKDTVNQMNCCSTHNFLYHLVVDGGVDMQSTKPGGGGGGGVQRNRWKSSHCWQRSSTALCWLGASKHDIFQLLSLVKWFDGQGYNYILCRTSNPRNHAANKHQAWRVEHGRQTRRVSPVSAARNQERKCMLQDCQNSSCGTASKYVRHWLRWFFFPIRFRGRAPVHTIQPI